MTCTSRWILLALSVSLTSAPAFGQIVNGDFSRGQEGWTRTGAVFISTADQYALFGNLAGGDGTLSQSIFCPVPHGCELAFDHRDVRGDEIAGQRMSTLRVVVGDVEYGIKGSNSRNLDWRTRLVPVPPGEWLLSLISSSHIGSEIALDNVRLVTAVPVAPTGWGRIKAMYRSDNPR